jgi:hypothetical protein
MGLKLNSVGGGSITLDTISTTNNITLNLVDVPGNLAPVVSGNAVTTTSGTNIDFTGIPSWVKRITIILSEVSTSGANNILLQIGAGSVSNTGYVGTHLVVSTATPATGSTTASFTLASLTVAGGGEITSGIFTLININENNWVFSGSARSSTIRTTISNGHKSLTSTLDRVRITTTTLDNFDAGRVNILYE